MASEAGTDRDTSLSADKDDQLAYVPNERDVELDAEQVVAANARDLEDRWFLMRALFAPPRPAEIPGVPSTEHPEGCPCKRCCNRRNKAEARRRATEDPSIVPHGTPGGHDYYGCRCADCKAADAKKHPVSKKRRLKAVADAS